MKKAFLLSLIVLLSACSQTVTPTQQPSGLYTGSIYSSSVFVGSLTANYDSGVALLRVDNNEASGVIVSESSIQFESFRVATSYKSSLNVIAFEFATQNFFYSGTLRSENR